MNTGGYPDLVWKPLPMFKGHFGRKRYPFLGIFLEIQAHFSQFFSQTLEILEKGTHVLGYFCRKWDPRLGISCEKATHMS